MPGVLGIVGENPVLPESRLQKTFREMCRRSMFQSWYTLATDSISIGPGGAAFGQCGLGVLEEKHAPLAKTSDGSVAVAVCGEFFNTPELLALLKNEPTFAKNVPQGFSEPDPAPAELALAGYLTLGKAFFTEINGRFHAAIFDARKREILLTCDRFASRPLYWTQTTEHFLFAAEMKTLLAEESVPRRENLRAMTDFFTFGQYFHDETSLEAVRVLPPAAWFRYSVQSRTLVKDTYWHPAAATISVGEMTTVNEVADAFHAAVLRQTKNTSGLGVSLSGGLDSRSVLGMVENPENVITVALGVPGSADHHLATQLAKLAGTRHFNFELNTDFLQSYERQLAGMVHLTDGQYLSSSIVIPTLPFYREKGIRTLLRGHAGELMHMGKAYAFSLTAQELASQLTTADGVFQWAIAHLQAYMLDGVNEPLLKDVSAADFRQWPREALQRALADANIDRSEPVSQVVWALYLRLRVAREVPLSMRKFDSQVNIRLPFLDNRLVDMLLALPPEQKMEEALQQAILQKYRPDFLRVKNVNTGTYIGSGRLRQKLAGLQQKICEKLGLPGYQPYEKMGLWLRRELRPTLETLLLTDRCLDRGVFRPDTLRRVVEEHQAGTNHTYLLLAMMIAEQRARFFESEK